MFNWKKRKLIVAVLLIVTVIGISSLFWLWLTPDTGSQPEVTETVIRGDIEKNVLATGILKPALQVNVGAQANGQLKKLYVKQGDFVKRGQLLAEIDPTLQENELRKSRAELQSSLAQKDATEALLKQYQLELKRQQMMNRDGAAVQSDVDKAASQYASQVAQLRVNEAQIIQSQMALETAKANLGYTRILAPIDGEVLGIVTKEGQTIVSSQTVPTILVLANVDIMTVHTRISETDILKVHVGQPLWFYVVADPQHRYESVMDAIQEAPNEALQDDNPATTSGQQPSAVYYNGVFDINNSTRQLRTSMTAQVFIVTAQAKNVLKVPVSALGQQQGKDKYQLLVKQDGKIQPRWVSIGINDRRYAEVKEGLKEGDIVVLAQLEDRHGQ
ncbi:efflux RND transporter periplasmic adaptor subunit [Buttiauxella noackiae]|uniref:efflux RND transporter periplasmic adaptor subunit n=1 Tax=Buttiauxella noackiae TaxID=82992 RepID=UPI0028D67D8A|nr:efflux RND transporter periplasmic adaptor subunit [Buttiauxella noackiae]